MPSHLYDPEVPAAMLRVLKANGIKYREKTDFIYVQCPFHKGESLGYWLSKSGKIGKCWKCEHHAGWNDYAKAAGLCKARIPKIEKDTEDDYSLGYLYQALDGAHGSDNVDLPEMELPHGITKWSQPWRHLRRRFLLEIGVFRWYDDASRYYRILFPITMGGVLVGYQAGRGDYTQRYPKHDPKYRASLKLPSPKGFFGMDQVHAEKLQVLVLVEGVYDCLRLWQHHIPAIANLGSDSVWNPSKAQMLIGLPELRCLVSALDWDSAGEKAHARVIEDLRESDIRVVRAALPKKKDGYHDVGSAPYGWVRSFREDLKGLGLANGWTPDPFTV